MLGGMAETGSPTDISSVVQANKDIAYRNIDEQAANLGQSFGAQGLRYSSDRYRGEGLVRERGAQDLNQTNMQLAYGSQEAARQRQIMAAELLGGLAGNARQSALAPIALALGQEIPNIMPSWGSQAVGASAPAIGYGASGAAGGKSTGGKGITNAGGGMPGITIGGGQVGA